MTDDLDDLKNLMNAATPRPDPARRAENLALAKENSEILVVCGSVFLMAEAREALGFQEPRDSDYISEIPVEKSRLCSRIHSTETPCVDARRDQ